MTSNKTIVLCYTQDIEYTYEGSPPLGILAIGSYLEAQGYAIAYYDARIHSYTRFKQLIAEKPLMVGFSVMGGFQITTAARLSVYVKKITPETTIIWGGHFPTMQPGACFLCPAVDVVVTGEGERIFAKLAENICMQHVLDDVPGIYFRQGSGIRHNTLRQECTDIEQAPFAYTGKATELLQVFHQRGFQRERIGYEASRGCAGRCSFCYSTFFRQTQPQVKSLQRIRTDLLYLKEQGVREIEIFDDTLLGGNREQIIQFAQIMRELELSWLANIRLSILDAELLGVLEQSGCLWLFIGIDEFSDIDMLRFSRIRFVLSIIAGRPNQSDAKIMEIVAQVKRIHVLLPQAEIQIQSFVPLPGTSACAEAVRHGFKLPQTLSEWSRYTALFVTQPWLRDKALPAKLYFSSFIAYRYTRHFSKRVIGLLGLPIYLLEKLRLQHSRFFFFVESGVYHVMLDAYRVYFLCRMSVVL